jgi:signal transduction histidine kinase/ActR/RegA family two-component response regulator
VGAARDGGPLKQRLRVVAAAVLVGGLTLTASGMIILHSIVTERDRQTFEANARNVQDAVTDRMETSIALLRGASGLLSSHGPDVTVSSFRAYMERVSLRQQYPGVLGIGFSRRFAWAERDALEQALRSQGHADFRVWPNDERAEGHAILFLEPVDDRNQAAIGYDMFTESTRRIAMERARDTGSAAASGIVQLVQEIDEVKQPGYLVYVPIYAGGAVPKTIEERREQLLGFAYAPIRAGDFLSSVFAAEHLPLASISVYHGREASDAQLLHRHVAVEQASRFVTRSTVDIAGQPWTFVFASAVTPAQAFVMPIILGMTGGLLSLLLFMLLWREANARSAVQDALEREQAARSQAERANHMKDQFLATLSHELRTPLSAIVGWAGVLRNDKLAEKQFRAGLDVVDRNALALARLIDDLLDMNRIASGKLSMAFDTIPVAAVVQDAVAAVASAAEAKSIVLEQVLEPLPLTVRGDAARLQQVFWNLLSNAVKFTPVGGTVRIVLERAGDCVRCTVADRGEGIDPAMLQQIFGRFAQADGSITRRHGGLGLGLAIAHELVVLHGGRISAHSDGPGRGATFIVELPLLEAGPAAIPPAAEAPLDLKLTGIRVLVVDDEPDVTELTRITLEQCSAEVHCAASAQEALEAIDEFQPDVLVSDIGMPGMNGYDLLRIIRGRSSSEGGRIPAIALTAYARKTDVQEALHAGYQRHLVKPVRADELIVAVAEAARAMGKAEEGRN